MNKLFYFAAAMALAGCATEFHAPVSGVIGRERAQGQSTARLDGNGTFTVSTLSGLTCNGTYNSLDQNPTIAANTTCNDGRTGRLLITRNINRGTGTVIGRLSDGTDARFVFGDISFAEAFGESGAATN